MNKIENVEARQEIYTHQGEAYYRIKWDGAWKPWRRLDNFGCNTPADLASLLGGCGRGVDATTFDWKANINPGETISWATNEQGAATYDYPMAAGSMTYCVANTNCGYVIASDTTGTVVKVKTKWGGNWIGTWHRIDNFGCDTPADLASLLGAYTTLQQVADQLENVDFSTYTFNDGIYKFSGTCTNTPGTMNNGYVWHKNLDGNRAFQFFFRNDKLYWRMKWSSNSWDAYQQLTLTAL